MAGPLAKVCKVFNVDDVKDGGRIQVLLSPEDNYITQTTKKSGTYYVDHMLNKVEYDLDWAFPLMPKMFYVIPKVGEYVLVFTAQMDSGLSQRYYIGPIVPQLSKLYNSNSIDALSMISGSFFSEPQSPDTDNTTKGAYPEKDDVCLEGRNGGEVRLTDDDVRICSGVRKVLKDNSDPKLNDDNTQAFIQLRYDAQKPTPNDSSQYNSSINVVADKINLIGNRASKESNNFETIGSRSDSKNEVITDDEIAKIVAKAHQLPYGDVLVEILQKMYQAIITHTHPWADLPPTPGSSIEGLTERMSTVELDMLSDNVRIN